jgi:hypothetical protein
MNYFRDFEYSGAAQYAHRRTARLVVKDGHLAHEVPHLACPQVRLFAVLVHDDLDLSLLDDVHAVSCVALADDDITILVLITYCAVFASDVDTVHHLPPFLWYSSPIALFLPLMLIPFITYRPFFGTHRRLRCFCP